MGIQMSTPKKSGLYWHRPPGKDWRELRVVKSNAGDLFAIWEREYTEVHDIPGEWVPALPPPDDDNEPVTAEWLESFSNVTKARKRVKSYTIGVGRVRLCYDLLYGTVSIIGMNDHFTPIGVYKTRGEFLALCKALQIPMEEG